MKLILLTLPGTRIFSTLLFIHIHWVGLLLTEFLPFCRLLFHKYFLSFMSPYQQTLLIYRNPYKFWKTVWTCNTELVTKKYEIQAKTTANQQYFQNDTEKQIFHTAVFLFLKIMSLKINLKNGAEVNIGGTPSNTQFHRQQVCQWVLHHC